MDQIGMQSFEGDGMQIVAYLDEKMYALKDRGQTVTGIIVGSEARKRLSMACQSIMNQPLKDDITVNKFRGALLIEDGNAPNRVEIIHAKNPTLPREESAFLNLRPAGGKNG